MQNTMRGIAVMTRNVEKRADEIMHAATDLSRRTERQAAQLEATAAAVDQVAATVRQTSAGAGSAAELATAASTAATASGKVVTDTIQAMNAIEASSHQIGTIIGVIDDIAFQTNLLALNAGVEAARAGDAGRGFAVVATEVRALAQRSADAAKEVKAIISASNQQVSAGAKLVDETGQALLRITEQVNSLSGLVRDIAAAAREQSVGLNQINDTMNEMDQVTQQNSAMVEATTTARKSLASEASALARLIGEFKIDPPNGTAPAPDAPTPAPHLEFAG